MSVGKGMNQVLTFLKQKEWLICLGHRQSWSWVSSQEDRTDTFAFPMLSFATSQFTYQYISLISITDLIACKINVFYLSVPFLLFYPALSCSPPGVSKIACTRLTLLCWDFDNRHLCNLSSSWRILSDCVNHCGQFFPPPKVNLKCLQHQFQWKLGSRLNCSLSFTLPNTICHLPSAVQSLSINWRAARCPGSKPQGASCTTHTLKCNLTQLLLSINILLLNQQPLPHANVTVNLTQVFKWVPKVGVKK